VSCSASEGSEESQSVANDAEELLQQLKQLGENADGKAACPAQLHADERSITTQSVTAAATDTAKEQEYLARALEERLRALQRDAVRREQQLAWLAAEQGRLQQQLEAAGREIKERAEEAEQAAAGQAAARQSVAQLTAELAEARSALSRKQEDARALGAAEREALQLRIEAMQADVEAARRREEAAQARVTAALAERDAAEQSRQEAEKARRQAELAASTAASVAEAERRQRAEAQGLRWARGGRGYCHVQALLEGGGYSPCCAFLLQRDAEGGGRGAQPSLRGSGARGGGQDSGRAGG
jgi:DNA repair exonuclease SbcCD ATPase subunit